MPTAAIFMAYQEVETQMNHKLIRISELANTLADMMVSLRRMEGISEDMLWESAYKHICQKLNAFADEMVELGRSEATDNVVPVTDLVPLDLPFQAKENPN